MPRGITEESQEALAAALAEVAEVIEAMGNLGCSENPQERLLEIAKTYGAATHGIYPPTVGHA